ncbi:hypothetical protein ACA910_020943 [Epithemia clementina (nom. ined.)]
MAVDECHGDEHTIQSAINDGALWSNGMYESRAKLNRSLASCRMRDDTNKPESADEADSCDLSINEHIVQRLVNCEDVSGNGPRLNLNPSILESCCTDENDDLDWESDSGSGLADASVDHHNHFSVMNPPRPLATKEKQHSSDYSATSQTSTVQSFSDPTTSPVTTDDSANTSSAESALNAAPCHERKINKGNDWMTMKPENTWPPKNPRRKRNLWSSHDFSQHLDVAYGPRLPAACTSPMNASSSAWTSDIVLSLSMDETPEYMDVVSSSKSRSSMTEMLSIKSLDCRQEEDQSSIGPLRKEQARPAFFTNPDSDEITVGSFTTTSTRATNSESNPCPDEIHTMMYDNTQSRKSFRTSRTTNDRTNYSLHDEIQTMIYEDALSQKSTLRQEQTVKKDAVHYKTQWRECEIFFFVLISSSLLLLVILLILLMVKGNDYKHD